MVTQALLTITVFWNKGYDVIIRVNDVSNKTLSRDSNYILDVFMWPKFGNSFLWERLSQPQFIKDWTRKTAFFESCLWFNLNNLGLALGEIQILHQRGKRVKIKCQKVLEANFYVCRSYRRKTGRRVFLAPILNKVKKPKSKSNGKTLPRYLPNSFHCCQKSLLLNTFNSAFE